MTIRQRFSAMFVHHLPHWELKRKFRFSGIPGGPNHVSAETINGVSKQLTIAIRNSNYQKI